MAEQDFVIDTKIGADTNGFEKAINGAIESISEFSNDIDSLGQSINEGCKEWGIDFSKFYSTGSDFLKNFGINIDQLASKLGMSGPLLASITAISVAMTKFGQEINGAFAEIVKGTGATGEALEGLKEDARKSLVNGIGQDIETVSVMIANLNTRFGVSGDELQKLTDTFDMFAQATGVDAKESINDVADVMAKWKIETEDTGALLDQLTKASQDSGASVNELMSGLKTGQSVFSQFGMSATQSIAYMSQLAKSGIETETALQGMKTALAKFANEGLNVEEAMKETAEAIKNASSNTEALQIATTVFGNRAGPEMVQVFKNGADSIEEYTKALTEAGGKLEETHELSRTSENAMTELIGSLKGTFAGFGQGFDTLFRDILDTIRNFVNFLEPVISPIGELFNVVFSYVGGLLKTFGDFFFEFETRFNIVWKAIAITLKGVVKFFKTTFGNLLNIVKDCFGLIFAIIDGKWELAWLYTKRILLTTITAILDGLSILLNGFNDMINKIIDKLNFLINGINKVATLLGFDEIKMIDPLGEVDLSEATGLNKVLKETSNRIDELNGKKADELVGELGEITDSSLQTANAIDTVTSSFDTMGQTAKETAVNLGKVVDMLKLDYEENLRYAESTKSTAEKQFNIKRKYLLDELAVFEETNEKERQEALATAKTEQDVATINKNFDDQLAKHRIETINAIIDAEKELNTQRENLVLSTSNYEMEMYKLTSNKEISELERTGASAEKIAGKKMEQAKKLHDMQIEIIEQERKQALEGVKTEEERAIVNQKYNLQIAQQESDLYETLSKYNKDFAKKTDKTFGEIVKLISQKIGSAMKAVAKFAINVGKSIVSVLNKAIELNPDKALDELLVFEDKVLTFFVETLPQLPAFLASALQSVIVMINNVFDAFDPSIIAGMVGDAVNFAIEMIPGLIEKSVNTLTNLVGVIGNMLMKIIPKLAKYLPKLIKQILKALPKIIKSVAEEITRLLPVIVQALVEMIPEITATIIECLPEIVSAILEVIPMLIVELIKAIPELGKALLNIFAQLGEWILSGLKIAFNAVGDFFKGIIDWFAEIGQKIADALSAPIRGVQNAFGAVGNFFGDVFGGIKNFFGFETGTLQAPKGLAIVGEAGPELVNFKGGEQVLNAHNTQKALATASGAKGNIWNVTFNNLQDTSAYAMMNQLKQYNRELALNGLI